MREVVAGLGCTPAECLALAVLVLGAVAALGLLLLGARPGQALPGPPIIDGDGAGLVVESEEVVVHVAGAVSAPGLYRLPGGARVSDALAAAGGPRPGAALDVLNLARPLTDGEQLLVPLEPPPGAALPTAQPAASPAKRPDGKLDLNRATADDLDELPGIGPVLAERIVSHRERTGGFRSVGQLRDVPGIGEKTFQELSLLVAV
ncbi:MAG: helix-hairpin-helix domain-containing protein [Egibacteraceae bacterium]